MNTKIITRYHTETHQPADNVNTAEWVSDRIWGDPDGFKWFASMSVLRGGLMIGGVVFHDWQQDSGTVEMSCAGDAGWLTRRVVRDAMGFCFDLMRVQMVIGRARADNEAALRMDRIIYANEFVIPRMFGRDCDGHVFTLTREQWLTHKFNGGKKA